MTKRIFRPITGGSNVGKEGAEGYRTEFAFRGICSPAWHGKLGHSRRCTVTARHHRPQRPRCHSRLHARSVTDGSTDLHPLPAVGKSIFKNGAKVCPDLAPQAAHPGEEIAPFAFQLNDGEFFDVCTMYPKYSSWGKFASYSDAFTAAAKLKDLRDAGVQIRIMVPTVTEFRGKDSRGHEIVLGRSVEYTSTRLMARLLAEHPGAGNLVKNEGTHV